MNLYTIVHAPYIWLWSTMLASCTRTTYDNYNTIEIHETLINNYFATNIQY